MQRQMELCEFNTWLVSETSSRPEKERKKKQQIISEINLSQ